jgi:hypothetical protein
MRKRKRIADYHSLDGLNNKHSLLPVLEAGNSRSRHSDLMSCEGIADKLLLTVFLYGRKIGKRRNELFFKKKLTDFINFL